MILVPVHYLSANQFRQYMSWPKRSRHRPGNYYSTQKAKSAAATSLVGEKNVKTQAKKEAPVPEGELDSHKGMQGEMSYHGYDEDWHTEYKGMQGEMSYHGYDEDWHT